MGPIVISEHARFEMGRRRIEESLVLAAAQAPEQVVTAAKGRVVHQSRYYDATEAKEMLLRVIIENREGQLFVVTAYKTSRIDKYWQGEEV